MTRKNLVRAALAVLTSFTVLAGCGDNATEHDMESTSSSQGATAADEAPTGQHNAADVSFLQQMIPHHQQAVEMSELVDGRTTTTAVVDLAEKIARAQGPEIDQMTAWLTAWGEPTESTGSDHSMPGMDHESTMPGMMSDEQMTQLEQSNGAAFDRQWLAMMIAHHQGAIDMANAELSDGANDDVKALAQQIVTAQDAEIREMQAFLPHG